MFSILRVCRPRHQLNIDLSHREPAYLDEEYPVIFDVTNADTRELEVTVDVLLQPTEADDAGATWLLDLIDPILTELSQITIYASMMSSLQA